LKGNKPGRLHYDIIDQMSRVVVTGMGAVSPVGNSLGESWASVKAGKSGIMPITRFDASRSRWKFAGELKGFDPGKYLARKEILRLDPFVLYAVAAAMAAAQDAGLTKNCVGCGVLDTIPPRFPSAGGESRDSLPHTCDAVLEGGGVIIGSSRGGISTLEKSLAGGHRPRIKRDNGTSRVDLGVSPYLMPSTTISMASSYVAQKLGMKGYCLGISNACASGASAIGEAYRLIKSGYDRPVFCGGAEAPVCKICFEGYGASGAISRINDSSASRPFDRTRDGFVLSEGACIVVLEDYWSALKRGAVIYGEIVGYGNTTDGFHQTAPSPEGEARAIRMAVDEAGLRPEEIHFISAHGTSTPLGDKAETDAIKLVLGRHAYHIPVTSLKSSTGHMLAASGALEAALLLLSMKEGVIPPTINLKERDPGCDLDYVTGLRKSDIEYGLTQSFGFGGLNAVLVFKRIA
jgi:3-oxoacyl-[acyl-carrier-protein] synthase II